MNMSITISTVSTLITPAGRNLKMRLKSLFENYEGFAVSNVANAREHVLPFDYFVRAPLPIPNLRQILAMLRDVLLVFDEFVADGLLGVGSLGTKLRHAVNHVRDEMKAVEVVHHHHVKRSRGRAFFFVTAHVEGPVVGAAIGEPMNQPGITVIGEDDRFVGREEHVEVLVGQTVRMFAPWLEF